MIANQIEEGAPLLAGRPLCHVEKGLWKFDQAAPMNIAAAARIRGPLTEAILRTALAALRARHPYLRARIEVDARGGPSFQFSSVGPIPLRVVQGEQEGWIHEFDSELNERIPCGQGPLGRCVLVRHGSDDVTVLLTVHHAASDGESMRAMMRDLLHACGQVASGLPPGLLPLDDIPSVEARSPQKLWSKAGVRLTTAFVAEEIRLLAKHGAPFKVPRDHDVPVHLRRFRSIPRCLDKARTARLLARAKAERTTVHGALCSAMILGALREAGVSRPERVTLVSPVNLRSVLVPPVGDNTGYYVSMMPYRAAVRPDVPFWDLARSVREQMAPGLSRGDAALLLEMLDGVFHLLRGHLITPVELASRWENGRLDDPEQPGPAGLRAQHGPVVRRHPVRVRGPVVSRRLRRPGPYVRR
jgi:hypothetical protein